MMKCQTGKRCQEASPWSCRTQPSLPSPWSPPPTVVLPTLKFKFNHGLLRIIQIVHHQWVNGCFNVLIISWEWGWKPANEEALNHQLLEDAEGEDVGCLAVPSNLRFKRILFNLDESILEQMIYWLLCVKHHCHHHEHQNDHLIIMGDCSAWKIVAFKKTQLCVQLLHFTNFTPWEWPHSCHQNEHQNDLIITIIRMVTSL